MDDELKRLLAVCAEELEDLDADWAVGGALAMAAHGFARHTQDIDICIGDDVREELLERLSTKGHDPQEVFGPIHYTLVPNRAKPDMRIDLLFPSSAPETLAMMAARPADVEGVRVPVWPLAHVVAAKILVDPAVDPNRARRDGSDLEELWLRGLIDADRVFDVLDDVGDHEARQRFARFLEARRGPPP